MFDAIDLEIINILKSNSKFSHKEIGEKIHLTGQAVGVRIAKLLEDGIINHFTIDVNYASLNLETAYIRAYKTPENEDLLIQLLEDEYVKEAYFIQSENCYLFKMLYKDKKNLDSFIEKVSSCSMYQIAYVEAKVK